MTTTQSRKKTGTFTDFKVADLSLAEWGRKEIELAEVEMPGLMACRAEYGPQKPLAGARITGSLHMTIQTAVLIETLSSSAPKCAGRAATSSRPRTTRRRRSPTRDIPVYAWKGETLEEYWWCTEQIAALARRRTAPT